MSKWLEYVAAAQPTLPLIEPISVGYPSLQYLQKVISLHVVKKYPRNEKIDRALLCNEAVRLNLVLASEAALPEPKVKKKNSSWVFFDAVNDAGGENIQDEAVDSDEWLDNDNLIELIESRVEEKAPGDMTRADLMKMCVYLKLVSERQSNIPRPAYKSSEELKALWEDYYESKKKIWDDEQAILVAESNASRASVSKKNKPPKY